MCFAAAPPLLWEFDLVTWSQGPKPRFITSAIPSASHKQSHVLAEKKLETLEVSSGCINYTSYKVLAIIGRDKH